MYDVLIERNFGNLTGQHKNKIVEICSEDLLKTKNVLYFLKPNRGETFLLQHMAI